MDIKKDYENAAKYWDDVREQYVDDMAFAKGADQWPEEIKKERENDGRPCLTINKLPVFIRQVVNDSRQNKPVIRVSPVDDHADPDTAKIINGLIRNIEYTSNADASYDTAIDNTVTGGIGYWRVNMDYENDRSFDMELKIDRILDSSRVVPDPDSEAVDGSDWEKCFIENWKNEESFKLDYGDKSKSSWGSLIGNTSSKWVRDDHILVCEAWYKSYESVNIHEVNNGRESKIMIDSELEDPEMQALLSIQGFSIVQSRHTKITKITQYIYSADEELEKVDWPGIYIPIIPCYGEEYIDANKKRRFRSLITDAKDPQRNYNYWRTTATETVALTPKVPYIGPKGAFNYDPNWQTANRKNHSTLEYEGSIPPRREIPAGLPAGALQEAANSDDDLKATIGIFNSGLGNQSNEIAGVAINARKSESDNSTFHFIDNLARAHRYGGLVLLDLIPKTYGKRQILRILGENGEPENIQMMQQTNRAPGGKTLDVSRVYELGIGKYDLTVKTGPSFASKRQEAEAQMMKLMGMPPEAARAFGDIYAETLDWPGAEKLVERFKKMLPLELQDDQNPQLIQMQQRIQQMEQQGAQLQDIIKQGRQYIANLEMQLKNKNQEIQIKQGGLKVDEFEAQTDRLNAQTNRQKVNIDAVTKY